MSVSRVVLIVYHVTKVQKTVKCADQIPFLQDLVHVNVTKASSMIKRANHACVNLELTLTKKHNSVRNVLYSVRNAAI